MRHPEDVPSVLYLDLDAVRPAMVTAELEGGGLRVERVSSVAASQRLSILEMVAHDLVLLEARGPTIAEARRITHDLIGPQGVPVVPVVLLVDPAHTLPFSAAVDLTTITVPFQPAALRAVIEAELQLVLSKGTKRRVQQMATQSISLPIMEATSSSIPNHSPANRGRRWAPWLGAATAAAAVIAGVAGSNMAPEATTRLAVAEPPTAPSSVMAPAIALPTAVTTTTTGQCPDGMALIEGSTFQMGTDDKSPVLALARPAHSVAVGTFCMDRTEVTTGAYRECSDVGECKRAYRQSWWPQGQQNPTAWERSREIHGELCNEEQDDREQHPINCVTWAQAAQYCHWRGRALPSEAQWELAARGTDGRSYPWGDEEPSSETLNGCGAECLAWRVRVSLDPTGTLYTDDDGFPGTAPVGSFPEGNSAAGLTDLAGNVFEWTADPFVTYHDATMAAPDAADTRRVIRGGAFNSFRTEFADPALRFAQDAEAHSHGIGFRCVATPQ